MTKKKQLVSERKRSELIKLLHKEIAHFFNHVLSGHFYTSKTHDLYLNT